MFLRLPYLIGVLGQNQDFFTNTIRGGNHCGGQKPGSDCRKPWTICKLITDLPVYSSDDRMSWTELTKTAIVRDSFVNVQHFARLTEGVSHEVPGLHLKHHLGSYYPF